MLTENQAREIVRDSLAKAFGVQQPMAETLMETALGNLGTREKPAGFKTDQSSLNYLWVTLAGDPVVGVGRVQHYLDVNTVAGLAPDTKISALIDFVRQKAVGKLCSNPTDPHEQGYPYPASCPRCGYPV